jgi:hypothetical protein
VLAYPRGASWRCLRKGSRAVGYVGGTRSHRVAPTASISPSPPVALADWVVAAVSLAERAVLVVFTVNVVLLLAKYLWWR